MKTEKEMEETKLSTWGQGCYPHPVVPLGRPTLKKCTGRTVSWFEGKAVGGYASRYLSVCVESV